MLTHLAPAPLLRSAFMLAPLRVVHGKPDGDRHQRIEEAQAQVVRTPSFTQDAYTYHHTGDAARDTESHSCPVARSR